MIFDISLREFEADLLQGLGVILLLTINMGGRLLLQRLRLTVSAALRSELEDVAEKSLSWAISATEQDIRARGWDHVEVKTQILTEAARYAAARFHGALRRSSIKPGSVELTGLMERKLPAAAAAAHAVMALLPSTLSTPPGDMPQATSPAAAPAA